MNTRIFDFVLYPRRRGLTIIVVLFAFGIAGCGGSGGETPAGERALTPLAFTVTVTDVTGGPIEGADVTIITGGLQQKATTNASGTVSFAGQPTGDGTVAVSATGYEPETFHVTIATGNSPGTTVRLRALGAWAVARAIVLGTETVERTTDGSAMTFSVDVAVIDGGSQAIETLTSDHFAIVNIDCGWGGPRDCASDGQGNAPGPGAGHFYAEGGVLEFGLQPPLDRRPYIVGVLAERSTAVADWDQRGPALKSFFTKLGGNDSVGLASVQTETGATTLTVFGPFTRDGSSYLDAIDQLAMPAGDTPDLHDSLLAWIHQAAEADSGGIPNISRSVLVMTKSDLSISQRNEVAALARDLGVRVSTIGDNWALSELAVRTGGFVSEFDDRRQLPMIFGAMDPLLAGTLPYYRLQFRIRGEPGTFVPGGNAKVRMIVRVPASIPHNGVFTTFDVAIP